MAVTRVSHQELERLRVLVELGDGRLGIDAAVQYEKVLFLLRPSDLTRSLARKWVTVPDFPDGRFEICHQGLALPYLVFDKGGQVQ